jgi:hypothetical protein
VNFYNAMSIYALFHGEQVIYIGEGELGTRLRQHTDDHLADRWDSFSWLSPDRYVSEAGTEKAKLEQAPDSLLWSIERKALVELFEAIAVQFGMRTANSQIPDLKGRIVWMSQRRSEDAPKTLTEQVAELAAKLKEISKPQA